MENTEDNEKTKMREIKSKIQTYIQDLKEHIEKMSSLLEDK